MAAKEKGGDTCPICFDPLKGKEVWNISEQYEVVMMITLWKEKIDSRKTTGI
ncbi:hypothetical protein ACFUP3_17305 [Bacillus paralicheniformis]|uniref:hypothetical protein n=1 Tax=Bacillus paralicheniformis TaxID=1648923 RepID=UPI003631DD6E